MKDCNARASRYTSRLVRVACTAILAAASTASLAHGHDGHDDHGDEIRQPAVPANIRVDSDNRVYFVGHAVGTQNYICLPSGTSFKYTLFTPQATLFNEADKEVITHYFSPNPEEQGTVRATWQHSRDSSRVWGAAPPADTSTDANFVKPGAIAWLKVTATGHDEGPNGGDTLVKTTFIQRLNTSGGLAPTTGCSSQADVGRQAFMPYRADYFFYTADR
jgi:hypothetical protein